jgi:hypothetical protein
LAPDPHQGVLSDALELCGLCISAQREYNQESDDEKYQPFVSHKTSFLTLSCAHPFLDGTIDSGEDTRINAVFMPRSCRVLGVAGKIHRTKKAQAKKLPLWKKAEFRATRDSKPPGGRN